MTILIIIITSAISIYAFSNRALFVQLQFNPYQTWHRREWYRFLSHGLLHANWTHLIVNMFVLFSFGGSIESAFRFMCQVTWFKFPIFGYLVFYLLALILSSITTLRKHKNNSWYNSVGASGAISAVLFCSIFFNPNMTLLFMGIIPIKAYIFGPLYLVYSWYAARNVKDNINHDAHLYGAVFGFCFPLLIDVRLIQVFISQF